MPLFFLLSALNIFQEVIKMKIRKKFTSRFSFPKAFLILFVMAGLAIGFVSLLEASGSKTLKVPSEYKTIQAAIYTASSGDTIQVAAGKYTENIVLREGVILQGAGADVTTIDGGGKGNVVEGATGAVLEGFTVTNSGKIGKTGDVMDVGISAKNAPMTIANCRIIGNNAGIRTYFSPSNIVNNIVADNNRYGLYILYSDSSVKNNIVYNNGSYGVYSAYSNPELINNTIFKNFDGIYSEVSKVLAKNNILIKNKEAGIRWQELPDSQDRVEPILSSNLVWGNKTDYVNVSPAKGDISEDPNLVDLSSGDVHLKNNSPAINAGSEDAGDNDPDGTRCDIGVYGGPLAQKKIPSAPNEASYASLKIKTEQLAEPAYGNRETWGGEQGNESGKGNYNRWCVPCHGGLGKGDGLLAETLGDDVKPTDLSNTELLSLRTDDILFVVIKSGGRNAGLSDAMMSFGENLSDEEIKNIIAYIRSDICKCQYNP
ncbi:MAG: Cytochrome c protein [Deltaproteobacteria bacterium]|nr:Cytochrome c protein [Deltaproteobacteria bacterium]